MKVDAESPGYFSMLEFPDEVVVSVRKRTQWEKELDVTRSEVGQEGAWYVGVDRSHEALEPFSEDGEGDEGNWRRLLFRLKPEVRPGLERVMSEHRFLFRFWETDVYVPRIQSVVFVLKRHETEAGVTWELKTPEATLYGIDVGGTPV